VAAIYAATRGKAGGQDIITIHSPSVAHDHAER